MCCPVRHYQTVIAGGRASMNTDRLCDRLWKGKQGAPLALLSPLVRKLTQELTPSRRFAVCGHCSAVSRMEMPLASSGAWAPVGSDPRRGRCFACATVTEWRGPFYIAGPPMRSLTKKVNLHGSCAGDLDRQAAKSPRLARARRAISARGRPARFPPAPSARPSSANFRPATI